MSDDELSVRLDWPERSNEPFSPPADDLDRGSDDVAETGGTELAQLRRAVAELRAEVSDLRDRVERLGGGADAPGPEPAGRRARREPLAPPRPINVRTRGPKSS